MAVPGLRGTQALTTTSIGLVVVVVSRRWNWRKEVKSTDWTWHLIAKQTAIYGNDTCRFPAHKRVLAGCNYYRDRFSSIALRRRSGSQMALTLPRLPDLPFRRVLSLLDPPALAVLATACKGLRARIPCPPEQQFVLSVEAVLREVASLPVSEELARPLFQLLDQWNARIHARLMDKFLQVPGFRCLTWSTEQFRRNPRDFHEARDYRLEMTFRKGQGPGGPRRAFLILQCEYDNIQLRSEDDRDLPRNDGWFNIFIRFSDNSNGGICVETKRRSENTGARFNRDVYDFAMHAGNITLAMEAFGFQTVKELWDLLSMAFSKNWHEKLKDADGYYRIRAHVVAFFDEVKKQLTQQRFERAQLSPKENAVIFENYSDDAFLASASIINSATSTQLSILNKRMQDVIAIFEKHQSMLQQTHNRRFLEFSKESRPHTIQSIISRSARNNSSIWMHERFRGHAELFWKVSDKAIFMAPAVSFSTKEAELAPKRTTTLDRDLPAPGFKNRHMVDLVPPLTPRQMRLLEWALANIRIVDTVYFSILGHGYIPALVVSCEYEINDNAKICSDNHHGCVVDARELQSIIACSGGVEAGTREEFLTLLFAVAAAAVSTINTCGCGDRSPSVFLDNFAFSDGQWQTMTFWAVIGAFKTITLPGM
ncbi:hypothetical protein BDZ88DRAFT_492228 [Geranomyces variabilis]|nr:hypothetical protein BDZ88DRAFT_492228 [Geranomyces variabilis]KAJ3134961.1 hypothetical protein HDU90_004286 [Geranomyces variabilis]